MTAPDPIIERLRTRAKMMRVVEFRGCVTRIIGCVIHARIPDGCMGEECLLRDPVSKIEIRAEIIGFNGSETILAPAGDIRGLSLRTEVIPMGSEALGPAGEAILGRVVDAFGHPLDGLAPVKVNVPVNANPPSPLDRPSIDTPFETGLRVIDGLLTMGEGQRVGIFGAAGLGKSTLLSQIVRGAKADAVVLGLIGERGREVAEFLERGLGEEGRKRAAIVVATSDRPACERYRAVMTATACAEELRRKGKHVLLLIDSMTRVARAMREIGLAAGEPPVRRGFPSSVFAALPRLTERLGRTRDGAITAIYTILVDDGDNTDPIADEMRSLLDGHILLSHRLSEQGHYPAIDVLRSKSRLVQSLASNEQLCDMRTITERLSKLEEIEILVQVGEYQSGTDPIADAALSTRKAMSRFLKQETGEFSDMKATLIDLNQVAQLT